MSIVLAGVGGQGILLASAIIARAAMLSGYDVKTNEVHGMAQRGGSVISQIRYGEKVHSPLVAFGSASVLGALESIEALRYAHYLCPTGLAVVSSQEIVPVTVSIGQSSYPSDVDGALREAFNRLIYIEAADIALNLGDVRAANVVVLGALSTGLDLGEDYWHTAISDSVKKASIDLNIEAFNAGRASAR